ncbi:MAG: segregation/condensation protein A [Nitrospinota bacterium]|jgi:segregation and condensation protein A|nr:segregation/condensation protein A [Nitrospinota bacterium]MDP7505237.1 segregation/condensation protein A [Nitrospinota bacterium]MDP7661853.1 segregation/condensation protein A [Nitrospinota bacterium]
MVVDMPENTNTSEDSIGHPAPGPESTPLEAVALEKLGVGSDRSAGMTDSWIIEEQPPPLEFKASATENMKDESIYRPNEKNERFNIKLDVFEGPMELLLHLIREHKLDIHDIPIAFITEQYLRHIEMMKILNINIASDYLVMASWLVYVKSRTLLPQQEGEENAEEDPEALRLELQRQLLEYQKFKSMSNVFRQAEEVQACIFPRGGNGDGIMLNPADIEKPPPLEISVFDLISAIQKMIEDAGEEGVHLVEVDELEVADRLTRILDILDKAGPEGVEFNKLFDGAGPRRLLIAVTFLALLELIRLNLILARQSAIFGEIQIYKAVKDDD